MSYDKGKTIREYMQGGNIQPMGYAAGGYADALSRFKLGLDKDKAFGLQEAQSRVLGKQSKERGLFGGLGSTALAGLTKVALPALLTTMSGGAINPMTMKLIMAGAGAVASGLGKWGGEKLAEKRTDTSGVGTQSSTGLFKPGFKQLGQTKREIEGGAAERALGAGIDSLVKSGSKELGGALLAKAPRLFGDAGARSIGLGGDAFAKDVTAKGIADNPWLETASDVDDAWAAGLLDSPEGVGGQSLSQAQGLGLNVGIPSMTDFDLGRFYGNVPSSVSDALTTAEVPPPAMALGSTPQQFSLYSPNLIRNQMFNQGGVVRGYEDGGSVKRKTLYGAGADLDKANMGTEGDFYNMRRVLSIPAEQVGEGKGLRYYGGEGRSNRMSLARDKAGFDATQQMAFAPQDSIPFDMIEQYLSEVPQEKRGLRGLLGFQQGGQTQGYAGGGLINMLPFNRRVM